MTSEQPTTTDTALAVDIGGTKVDAALVDRAGRVLPGSRHRAPTGADLGPDGFERAIASVCSRAIAALPSGSAELVGIGVGSAGPLLRHGTAVSPLNLPRIRDFDLVRAVTPFGSGAPVRIGLDGTCIALAEHRLGALRGVRNGIAMVVSTGIGGGIVVDGRLLTGQDGNAGHVGQVWVRRPDAADAVAATVEAVASGPASIRWAVRHGWRGGDGRALAADYAAGGPVAVRAVQRSATAVGQAIAALAAVVDPEVVAIGGGFSHVASEYVALVEAAAHDVAVVPAARGIRVVRAALGDDAPLVGAALLVFADGDDAAG